jgi:hypothetical protein
VLKEVKFMQGLFSCCVVHEERAAYLQNTHMHSSVLSKAILKPGKYT